ncbi:hypothetical protein FACS1894181_04640 [Bacteroidia bacterium]|nr:hypothetical protein FACS1894181_04640 [Bacteroidia bacterium]
MLQYLIILLDDTATSYCHYNSTGEQRRLIEPNDLKEGIIFAMKHNLTVQFLYPAYDIPDEYKSMIETVDHIKMMPIEVQDSAKADVLIFNSPVFFTTENIYKHKDKILVLRSSKHELSLLSEVIKSSAENISRLNIVVTDTDTFNDGDFDTYGQWLESLCSIINAKYSKGIVPQINLLTDRILLDSMNNCNAGILNITLAPNGKFYVCPAFYAENKEDSIGNLKDGICIKNSHLYKLEYAPLCRNCDAYHCRRCVWLNRKTTLEVNTPSHEQCFTAHLERNAAKKLCDDLKTIGYFADKEIPSIDYLDPFDVRKKFNL